MIQKLSFKFYNLTPSTLRLYKTLIDNPINDEPMISLKSVAPQNRGNDRGRGAVKTSSSKEIDLYISEHMDEMAGDIGKKFGISKMAVRSRKNRVRNSQKNNP